MSLEPPSLQNASPQNTNESIDLDALTAGLLGLPNAEEMPVDAPTSVDEDQVHACWGGLLKGDHTLCELGFQSGKAHFKNKFCANCRKGLAVPAERIRAMAPEMKDVYQNSLRAGFWKTASEAIGGGEVRIANNTITCDGPWLVVYREGCPVPALPWETLPSEWLTSDGAVKFSVAKGTLVPVVEVRPGGKRPPPSYALAPNLAPKRQRRAHAPASELTLDELPASIRRAASAPDVAPLMAPLEACPPPVASLRSKSESDVSTIATHSAHTSPAASASPTPLGTPKAAPALGAATGVPLPLPAAVLPPPAVAACAKPPALLVSSPTLAKQPSITRQASPPGDPAQLAVRLVAAHEHIAAMLEQALKPLSPMRGQLSPTQVSGLYEHLNRTRAMIDECCTLAREPPAAPTPPTPPASSVVGVSAEEDAAFASLVEAAICA